MERNITAQALQDLLARRAPIMLLDVRLREDRDRDPLTVAGARWRDPLAIHDWCEGLDPGLPIVLYCVHGHRVSNAAVDTLQTKGFDARLIEGGLEAWKAAGGPTAPLRGVGPS